MYHDDLQLLNSSLTQNDLEFCTLELNPLSSCHNTDKEVKFLVLIRTKEVIGVKSNGERYDIRDITRVEKIFIRKLSSYLKKKASTTTQKIQNNNLNFSTSLRSSSSQDWCTSSPEIFPTSCRLHDNCYDTGGMPKNVCDDLFYENMFSEAESYTYNDFQALNTYLTLASVYFEAVVIALKLLTRTAQLNKLLNFKIFVMQELQN